MSGTSSSTIAESVTTLDSSLQNATKPLFSFGAWGSVDQGMLERLMIVLLGITMLIVMYFGVKIYCGRRRKIPIRRYDVLSAQTLEANLALDSDSEEDNVYDSRANLVKSEQKSTG